MDDFASDNRFFIEEMDDDDMEPTSRPFGEDGKGDDSDHSSHSNEQTSMPDSCLTSWPQSYRQSIDLYAIVQSPTITLLEPQSLTRRNSSLVNSSSFLLRHPWSTTTIETPLLKDDPEDDPILFLEEQPTRWKNNSHIIQSSVGKELEPNLGRSSFRHAVINGLNVLCGVGLLSTPYAAQQGGWLGILILLSFGVISFYTGMLLRSCLDSQPGLKTYPDIGNAAFGKWGRILISVILYVELYASCIEYIILESDSLSSLFPNAHLSLYRGLQLDARQLFASLSVLVILPTVWLRDLSVLSYISAGGVVASLVVVICLFWVGLVDKIGFHIDTTKSLNLSSLPVAVGLYGFAYAGHAVFPNIYSSMANPRQFPKVLITSFSICSALYMGVAVMGYTLFGDSTASQYTLNMPKEYAATKIAIWTTIINPFTKYALTLSPVALSLEELMPPNHPRVYDILLRTMLVLSSLIVGLSIPFFGLVMSLIGSLLSMSITLILPCACFLSISRGRITYLQGIFCSVIMIIGVVSSVSGSYSAITKILESLRSS